MQKRDEKRETLAVNLNYVIKKKVSREESGNSREMSKEYNLAVEARDSFIMQ